MNLIYSSIFVLFFNEITELLLNLLSARFLIYDLIVQDREKLRIWDAKRRAKIQTSGRKKI